MKKYFLLIAISASVLLQAQEVINQQDVSRIINVLAADDMRGRRAGTPDIDRAAAFLSEEFRKAGLQPLAGTDFLQRFVIVRPKLDELKYKAEGGDADAKGIIVITSRKELHVDEKSGYEISHIKTGENLMTRARSLAGARKNTITFVDTSFSTSFSRLSFLKRQHMKSDFSHIFILGSQPREYKIKADHSFEEVSYANVVGIIPGKSLKNEYVIFSAHYDHLGVSRAAEGDSIYNGANDDASGTTAVALLAKHFRSLNNNERTLIFAAFTAEESGGYGSQYFSQQLNPDAVVAMFNIEMIGTDSKWGKNSAYITGFEKSSMGEILQKNLKQTNFHFHPDPYPKENLFYRSDNATLAGLGVPAHTIATAKMEGEPHYHKVSDEVSTLDLHNMTQIIRAIAESSKSIVAGKDTPTRVKSETLN